jgi:hypothetical protein
MTVTVDTAPFAQRRAARERMLVMTERLIAEYADVFPAGSVIRCVSRYWIQLRNTGVDVDVDVVAATESAVRRRLSALRPPHRLL